MRVRRSTHNQARIAQEADLIRKVRQGDPDSFRPLVERYQSRVFRLLLRLVRDVHDAEDLCQETFLRAYKALSRFDTRYPFENWLLRIATNLARTELKRRRNLLHLSEGGHCVEARISRREGEQKLAELSRFLEEAIQDLSPKKRMALLLFHQAKRSYADIAEIMDIPVGTVKTVIHRAREELKRALQARGYI